LKKYWLIPALVLLSSVLFAHVTDTSKSRTKSPPVQYFQEKDISLTKPLYRTVDTSLDGVQNYFPNNFPYDLGLANRKLLFEPASEIGFSSGFDYLNLFGYKKEDIKYYHARTPYTEINVVFGMKKEQFSRLLHTQNITKQWNISFSMLRLRSEGFYQKQNCTDNNISFSTNYVSKNNRYSLLANGTVSSIKAEENGGIPIAYNSVNYDSTLAQTQLQLPDKKLFHVNLPDAKTKRGNREAYLKQSIYFGKKENIMKGDSIISHRINPKHSLSYSVNVQDNWFVYSEATPNSGYYEYTYFDTVKTLDSTHIFTLQNSISWKSTLFKNVTAELFFDQKTSHLVQYKADSVLATDARFSYNTIRMEIGKKPVDLHINGFYWDLEGNYVSDGNYQGDYRMNGNLFAVLKNNKKIFFELTNDLRSVPFLFSNYTSNHFRWRNTFDKISESRARINYTDLKHHFSIGAELNLINGYVYFDSTFSPKQFTGTLTVYSAFVQKNFHLKHFNFNNRITWQSAQDTSIKISEGIMHLPQFVTHHSLYYEGKWFSKVMEVQIGFDVSFYTSYYADAYMPALGQYYVQSRKEIGNYPFIDFFFNMKVKHANIFFKSEHLNSGLMGATYYLAPHMPAPDRSIKFGIRWLFYD